MPSLFSLDYLIYDENKFKSMNQKEFIKLSKEKVSELNLGNSEAEEAWRDGYLYAIGKIEEILNTKENSEACWLLEEMITDSGSLDQFE